MKRFLAFAITFAAIGGIFALIAFWSYRTTRWGGSCGFTQLEFEFKFQDPKGNPVEGLELSVEDTTGNKFFCFPVTDYVPGRSPKSDELGVMRFHHVSTAVEWDDYGWSLYWVIPIQSTKSPIYVCRFLLQGKEMHRIPYWNLPDWDWKGLTWEQVPKVKRRWNLATMTPDEIVWKPNESDEDYVTRMRRFFHIGDDGNGSREGRIALRNASWRIIEFERARRDNPAEPLEDLEFPVIKRTITLDLGKGD